MKPLNHLNVIEFEGIGPGPLCGRILADLGAHVTVVARSHRFAKVSISSNST
jgi:alpha-methylacyl-CoA racemase